MWWSRTEAEPRHGWIPTTARVTGRVAPGRVAAVVSTLEEPWVSSHAVPTDSAAESALAEALAARGSPAVASVYLFGSVERGQAHRESDVDIGVLLAWATHPTAADRFDAGIRLAGAVQAVLGHTVDLVVLNDAPPLLGRHAVTRGRRILCRDERTDRAYVRDVQLRAADLEPWLRRMRELKIRAIRG